MEVSTVTGVSDVVKRLYTVRGETAEGVERGLLKAGFFGYNKSQEFVPVDTSALKKSGYVTKEGRGFSTLVRIGYTQSYAIWVHERLDLRHRAPTMAKFLERPMIWYREEMVGIIRDEAQRRLSGMKVEVSADRPVGEVSRVTLMREPPA